MEIGLRVEAENYRTRERRHILSAYFTFVAVDEQGKPTPVPAVQPETSLQQHRFEQAEKRRARRVEEARERQQERAKSKAS